MFTRKVLVILSILVTLAAACGGRSTPTPTSIPDEVLAAPTADVSGNWSGTLLDTPQNFTFNMTMELVQAADGTVTGSGSVITPNFTENYTYTGTFDGTTLHLQEEGGRFYTLTLSDDTLSGYVAWNVYDDPAIAWGQITLTR